MENLVGDHLPSEAEVGKLVKQLEDVAHKLEAFTIKLTPDARRMLPKFRPGGDEVVARVATLAKKHDVDNDDTPVAGMSADLALVRRLAPLVSAATQLAERLDDTTLQAQGECWHAATSLYSLLMARAKNNAALASELADTRAFFATGRRAKKAVAPAK